MRLNILIIDAETKLPNNFRLQLGGLDIFVSYVVEKEVVTFFFFFFFSGTDT